MTNRAFDITMTIADMLMKSARSFFVVLFSMSMLIGAGVATPSTPLAPTPVAHQVGTVTSPELDDVDAEGMDVVVLTVDDAPDDLWQALWATHPEWYSDYGAYDSGEGAFYVPVGTIIDVPGGLYVAAPDEVLSCVDWQTTGAECGADVADIEAYYFDGTSELVLYPAV